MIIRLRTVDLDSWLCSKAASSRTWTSISICIKVKMRVFVPAYVSVAWCLAKHRTYLHTSHFISRNLIKTVIIKKWGYYYTLWMKRCFKVQMPYVKCSSTQFSINSHYTVWPNHCSGAETNKLISQSFLLEQSDVFHWTYIICSKQNYHI